VSSSPGIKTASKVTTTIATSHEGTALVNFGRKCIIAIVRTISPHIIRAAIPSIQAQSTLNWPT
jgi:hypothetical protein